MYFMVLLWFLLAAREFRVYDAFLHQETHRLICRTFKNHNSGYCNHVCLEATKSIIDSEDGATTEILTIAPAEKPRQSLSISAIVKFDISLAVILAGYSFEAYNEPVQCYFCCCSMHSLHKISYAAWKICLGITKMFPYKLSCFYLCIYLSIYISIYIYIYWQYELCLYS